MPDYAKAAAKHLRDSEVLLRGERWDGAAYHAGFVVECTLSALLVASGGSTDRGHNLSELEDCVNAQARKSRGRRLSQTQSEILRCAGFRAWSPTGIRYEAESVHTEPRASDWLRAAKTFYHSVKP
jgi:HEPN domain-containing protein